MTSQDYTVTRQQRESNAEAHYYETHRKYAALGKNADDINSWWEWREHHGSRYAHHEYPKPYCGEYFGHFIRSVMGSRFVDLKPWLNKEFVGDEVDRDYLEGLLDYAEQTHGLHQDRAMLVLRNGDEVSYDPLPLGQAHRQPDGVASSNVIRGGEEFRRRAAIIRAWCRSKADTETATKAQHILLHRRQLEALAHEQEMTEKHSVYDESGCNIGAGWSGEKEVIDANGKPHLLFYQDRPKPHSSFYIGYFLNYIQKQDLEDITPWLNREFNNDAVDKKYVNGLLIELENLGMDVEGTTVVQQGEEFISYPPNPIDAAYSYAENVQRIECDNLSRGGIKFVRRARIIREWCRLDEAETASELLHIGPSSSSTVDFIPEASPSAGTPTGTRDFSCLDYAFSCGFKTEHCDRLAQSLDLCPPDQTFERVNNAHTKIWVLVDAIRSSESYSMLTANKLAKLLGKRYGYTVADKLTKKSENKDYHASIRLVCDSIKRMEKQGEFK